MIYYSITYKSDIEFCNRFMSTLPNDNDFAFFIINGSFDTLNYNDTIEQIINEYDNVDCFVPVTNIDRKITDINFGKNIQNIFGNYCVNVTESINFVESKCVLINKKTWINIGGFKENLFKTIISNKVEVYQMKGVYVNVFPEKKEIKDKVIIIPVHNQLPYLISCISTVISHTKNFKLIIVDDGSTDKDTIDWLDSHSKEYVVLRNDTAKGFSIACNKGIDYAMEHFDFYCLCLLNSDTEIKTNNWFEKVERYFQENENIGLASVVSDNATHQSINDVEKYLKNINEKPTLETRLVHGFCYFMGKNIIESIGRFDDDKFPHYGSEDDFALKSIKYGFKNIIVGSVFVLHKGHRSYSSETRSTYIKKSSPDLLNRWTKKYVDECLEISYGIQKILNQ